MVSYDLKEFLLKHSLMDQEYIWVFGYGSLMWNPSFEYQSKRRARLEGYHRRFCMYSKDYRGTPQEPGLVLGLDKGGYCEGIAFQILNQNIKDCLRHLWERESGYIPVFGKAVIEGQEEDILFFIADQQDKEYYCAQSREDRISIVLKSSGMGGCNLEYVMNTAEHLEEMNIQDHSILSFVKDINNKLSD